MIIQLKKGKEVSILRKHPWIFSGALKLEQSLPSGTWVEVQDWRGNFLAEGFYNDGSIAIRLMSFDSPKGAKATFRYNIDKAFAFRKHIGLLDDKLNTACRLVFGEADLIPGLVVDYYEGYIVYQMHSEGLMMHESEIIQCLIEQQYLPIKGVYNKSGSTLKKLHIENKTVFGDIPSVITFLEDGIAQKISVIEGQKTGAFLDQKLNRLKVKQIANNKRVLNLFSYTGGFSIAALSGGASWVDSVDISEKATQICNQNIQSLGVEKIHKGITMDVFDFLKTSDMEYDIVIVDPPAFAKTLSKRHNAIQAYVRLNTEVFKKCKPGTQVFTFSCTGVVTEQLFMGAITSAAIQSRREIKSIEKLGQPEDHPISIYHPEGHYLKGYRLWVQ